MTLLRMFLPIEGILLSNNRFIISQFLRFVKGDFVTKRQFLLFK